MFDYETSTIPRTVKKQSLIYKKKCFVVLKGY